MEEQKPEEKPQKPKPESYRRRGLAGDMQPLGPEKAKAVARIVEQLWVDNPELLEMRRGRGNMCGICASPAREEINALILMNGTQMQVSRAIGKPAGRVYNLSAIVSHREKHLYPLIEQEIRPTIETLIEMPYPFASTLAERGVWYIMQCYGIRQEALRRDELALAVSCLREMRAVEMGMLGGPAELPSPANLPALRPPAHESSLTAEQEANLERAFKLSRESIKVEQVTNENEAQPGADPVGVAGGAGESPADPGRPPESDPSASRSY